MLVGSVEQIGNIRRVFCQDLYSPNGVKHHRFLFIRNTKIGVELFEPKKEIDDEQCDDYVCLKNYFVNLQEGESAILVDYTCSFHEMEGAKITSMKTVA